MIIQLFADKGNVYCVGEASPYAAISLIAPCGPHSAIREIRRYPL